MWGFEAVREHAIKEIDGRFTGSYDPFDRLALADKCDVRKWRWGAYWMICQRPEPLTIEESSQLGIKRFTAVARARETYSSRYPDIRHCHMNQLVQCSRGRPHNREWYSPCSEDVAVLMTEVLKAEAANLDT